MIANLPGMNIDRTQIIIDDKGRVDRNRDNCLTCLIRFCLVSIPLRIPWIEGRLYPDLYSIVDNNASAYTGDQQQDEANQYTSERRFAPPI